MKVLAWLIITLMLDWSIEMMICFLDGSLMVLLIWGLTNFDILRISLTSIIFLRGKLEKVSLRQMIFSTFDFKPENITSCY